MGTFRRMVGVTPETLRAWERRHALLRPVRGPGGHRLYTEEDLQVMRQVVALHRQGRSIGEIAEIGRAALLDRAEDPPPTEPEARARSWADRIIHAAMRMDRPALIQALDEAFAALTPLRVAEEVISPVATEIGERWVRGELTVAGEHMVSVEWELRLHKLVDALSTPNRMSAPVICATLSGEQHVLGLLVVALHLVSASVPVLYLGASVPMADLEQTLRSVDPRALCLSVTHPQTLDATQDQLAALARRWERGTIYVGGHGTYGDRRVLLDAGVVVWPPQRSLRWLGDALRLDSLPSERSG